MDPTREEIVAHYAALADAPLLALAEERDDLTEESQALLLAELRQRRLSVPPILPRPQERVYDAQTWVTIDRFRDLSSALVARGALEAANIPCFLRDENTVRLDWQLSNFIGGMRLQIPAAEEETARAVLTELTLENEPASDAGTALADEHCPVCGNMHIARRQRYHWFSVVSVWLFGLPFAVRSGKPYWICDACHATWPDEPSL